MFRYQFSEVVMKLFTAFLLFAAGALSVYARLVSRDTWHAAVATALGVLGLGMLEALGAETE